MEKAYDLKDLANRLKADGLSLVEDELRLVYKHTKEWAKESAVLSTTPYDNIVMPFIDQLDGIVLPLIDKIDGQVDPA